jgi:hypothetical protein
MNTQVSEKGHGHHGYHFLPLMIEGKEYEWKEQYITGTQVKKLGNLPADSELFLSIIDPWKDEPVKDEDKVDLARPGIEQFFIKRKLKYTIDRKEFESEKQFIKGAQIRKQGQVKDGYQIFLSIKGPWEDELIKDDDWVDLARPGIEHFYSCKPNTNNG